MKLFRFLKRLWIKAQINRLEMDLTIQQISYKEYVEDAKHYQEMLDALE